MVDEFRTAHFSTDETVPEDRLAVWREVIGHTVLRLDISSPYRTSRSRLT
jgi:hypothetical protein